MARFVILLAGRIEATQALLDSMDGCRVIAADAGLAHACPLGVVPELVVGDFDSGRAALAGHAGLERVDFPADKDQTDGELAIEAAIGRGARGLLLVGALGGPRSDHAFAHLVLALRYAGQGLDIELFDGLERAWPLRPGIPRAVDLVPGTQFSILKFSDLTGLTVEGAAYPLDRIDLPFESILTQSNEATGPIRVSFETGRAILIAQADPSRR